VFFCTKHLYVIIKCSSVTYVQLVKWQFTRDVRKMWQRIAESIPKTWLRNWKNSACLERRFVILVLCIRDVHESETQMWVCWSALYETHGNITCNIVVTVVSMCFTEWLMVIFAYKQVYCYENDYYSINLCSYLPLTTQLILWCAWRCLSLLFIIKSYTRVRNKKRKEKIAELLGNLQCSSIHPLTILYNSQRFCQQNRAVV